MKSTKQRGANIFDNESDDSHSEDRRPRHSHKDPSVQTEEATTAATTVSTEPTTQEREELSSTPSTTENNIVNIDSEDALGTIVPDVITDQQQQQEEDDPAIDESNGGEERIIPDNYNTTLHRDCDSALATPLENDAPLLLIYFGYNVETSSTQALTFTEAQSIGNTVLSSIVDDIFAKNCDVTLTPASIVTPSWPLPLRTISVGDSNGISDNALCLIQKKSTAESKSCTRFHGSMVISYTPGTNLDEDDMMDNIYRLIEDDLKDGLYLPRINNAIQASAPQDNNDATTVTGTFMDNTSTSSVVYSRNIDGSTPNTVETLPTTSDAPEGWTIMGIAMVVAAGIFFILASMLFVSWLKQQKKRKRIMEDRKLWRRRMIERRNHYRKSASSIDTANISAKSNQFRDPLDPSNQDGDDASANRSDYNDDISDDVQFRIVTDRGYQMPRVRRFGVVEDLEAFSAASIDNEIAYDRYAPCPSTCSSNSSSSGSERSPPPPASSNKGAAKVAPASAYERAKICVSERTKQFCENPATVIGAAVKGLLDLDLPTQEDEEEFMRERYRDLLTLDAAVLDQFSYPTLDTFVPTYDPRDVNNPIRLVRYESKVGDEEEQDYAQEEEEKTENERIGVSLGSSKNDLVFMDADSDDDLISHDLRLPHFDDSAIQTFNRGAVATKPNKYIDDGTLSVLLRNDTEDEYAHDELMPRSRTEPLSRDYRIEPTRQSSYVDPRDRSRSRSRTSSIARKPLDEEDDMAFCPQFEVSLTKRRYVRDASGDLREELEL